MKDAFSLDLPEGFSLCCEGDFLRLVLGDEEVASFSRSFLSKEILLSVAETYRAAADIENLNQKESFYETDCKCQEGHD